MITDQAQFVMTAVHATFVHAFLQILIIQMITYMITHVNIDDNPWISLGEFREVDNKGANGFFLFKIYSILWTIIIR